jgi:hypothetical protein
MDQTMSFTFEVEKEARSVAGPHGLKATQKLNNTGGERLTPKEWQRMKNAANARVGRKS